LLPFRFGPLSLCHRFAKMRQRLVRNEKRRLSRPAELLLRQLHFLLAQRRSVRFERILLARRSEADVGAHQNKRRPRGFGARSALGLRDGHANPIAETLTERSRGGFHSGCELTLRMAWRQASPLAELFDLIERDIVAGKIKHAVKQHRAMPGGEDEAVAIGP